MRKGIQCLHALRKQLLFSRLCWVAVSWRPQCIAANVVSGGSELAVEQETWWSVVLNMKCGLGGLHQFSSWVVAAMKLIKLVHWQHLAVTFCSQWGWFDQTCYAFEVCTDGFENIPNVEESPGPSNLNKNIWIKSSPCKSIGNAKKTLCRIMWVFALDSREYARWVANLCPERLRDFRKESCWHRIQSKLILLDPTKMNYCTHFNLRPRFWLRANLHQHASACIIHLWPCGLDWNSLLHPNLALSGRGIYL